MLGGQKVSRPQENTFFSPFRAVCHFQIFDHFFPIFSFQPALHSILRARRIGANPEKSDLVNGESAEPDADWPGIPEQKTTTPWAHQTGAGQLWHPRATHKG